MRRISYCPVLSDNFKNENVFCNWGFLLPLAFPKYVDNNIDRLSCTELIPKYVNKPNKEQSLGFGPRRRENIRCSWKSLLFPSTHVFIVEWFWTFKITKVSSIHHSKWYSGFRFQDSSQKCFLGVIMKCWATRWRRTWK